MDFQLELRPPQGRARPRRNTSKGAAHKKEMARLEHSMQLKLTSTMTSDIPLHEQPEWAKKMHRAAGVIQRAWRAKLNLTKLNKVFKTMDDPDYPFMERSGWGGWRVVNDLFARDGQGVPRAVREPEMGSELSWDTDDDSGSDGGGEQPRGRRQSSADVDRGSGSESSSVGGSPLAGRGRGKQVEDLLAHVRHSREVLNSSEPELKPPPKPLAAKLSASGAASISAWQVNLGPGADPGASWAPAAAEEAPAAPPGKGPEAGPRKPRKARSRKQRPRASAADGVDRQREAKPREKLADQVKMGQKAHDHDGMAAKAARDKALEEARLRAERAREEARLLQEEALRRREEEQGGRGAGPGDGSQPQWKHSGVALVGGTIYDTDPAGEPPKERLPRRDAPEPVTKRAKRATFHLQKVHNAVQTIRKRLTDVADVSVAELKQMAAKANWRMAGLKHVMKEELERHVSVALSDPQDSARPNGRPSSDRSPPGDEAFAGSIIPHSTEAHFLLITRLNTLADLIREMESQQFGLHELQPATRGKIKQKADAVSAQMQRLAGALEVVGHDVLEFHGHFLEQRDQPPWQPPQPQQLPSNVMRSGRPGLAPIVTHAPAASKGPQSGRRPRMASAAAPKSLRCLPGLAPAILSGSNAERMCATLDIVQPARTNRSARPRPSFSGTTTSNTSSLPLRSRRYTDGLTPRLPPILPRFTADGSARATEGGRRSFDAPPLSLPSVPPPTAAAGASSSQQLPSGGAPEKLPGVLQGQAMEPLPQARKPTWSSRRASDRRRRSARQRSARAGSGDA